MRLTHLAAAVTVALCSLTAHVPSAWADNTTCGNSLYLFPGEVAEDFLPGDGSVYFRTPVVAGRSYSIAAWTPLAEQLFVTGSIVVTVTLYRNKACDQLAADRSESDGEPPMGALGITGDRETIVPNFTGVLYIRITNLTSSALTTHLRMIETTLFSPWWFVGGTNKAFAEIRNNTNVNVALTATFFGSSGTVCGSSSVNLLPNGNTAVGIKVLGSCATAVSGSAQIAFHGAPGGVAANITTIDGVQGTSFDSPFTPRMVWGVSRR